MKTKFLALVVLAVLVVSIVLWRASAGVGNNSGLSLVPMPMKVVPDKGTFHLDAKTFIVAPLEAQPVGLQLVERVRKSTGYALQLRTAEKPVESPGSIVFQLTPRQSSGTDESYQVQVARESVLITAPSTAGLFYGMQTLLQLFPPEIFGSQPAKGIEWSAPCVRIEDRPRFAWRGALLDVARHFFTVEELKRYIDEIAAHKMNVLQLHLTDDQGWRVQIQKLPKLTEVGGWRKSIGFNLNPASSTAYGADGSYGGFYTQGQIRELVNYAQARQVTILPEIEMPGHAGAALAAYSNLSCSGGPYSTDSAANQAAGVFCVSNDDTYKFIDAVLAEVAQIFPGKYIHIGGDEVSKENWHKCEKCQALMKREGLKDERELQSYFIRRVEKIVNSKGKNLIGWSEILEGGLAQNATVMDWIGGGVEAASAGHDVIMSPTKYCYLDYYQSRNRTNEPPAIGAFISLRTVYSFEPIPPGLDPKYRAHILGAQGNVWTEYIPNLKQVEYMTFPRLCALAEVVWTDPKLRDWDGFVQRLGEHTRRLDAAGITWRKGFFEE